MCNTDNASINSAISDPSQQEVVNQEVVSYISSLCLVNKTIIQYLLKKYLKSKVCEKTSEVVPKSSSRNAHTAIEYVKVIVDTKLGQTDQPTSVRRELPLRIQRKDQKYWCISKLQNGITARTLLDSGATQTLLSKTWVKANALNVDPLHVPCELWQAGLGKIIATSCI